LTPRIRSVLSRIVSSSGASGAAPWPVPWAATLSSFSAAKRTVVAMSSAFSAKATATGRWSAARFQAVRAWSQSASSEVAIRPASASPVKSVIWVSSQSGERVGAESVGNQLSATRSTASPVPIKTSLTIAGGKSPCEEMPGSASRQAARAAGSPISPR
jgi:hypothetical protein